MQRYSYKHTVDMNSKFNVNTTCATGIKFTSQRVRGGRFLQGNLWYSPPTSMTSRLASVTFKMASKVFIEETDKNFDFITEIPFRFLGVGDFKVSIVIEN